MTFQEAVSNVLSNDATFSGRARRSEYWWYALTLFLVAIVAAVLDAAVGTSLFTVVLALGTFVPSLAVSIRRLHDIGRSGWWLLIGLIPLIGSITLLVFCVQDSQRDMNAHGPSPELALGGAPGHGC